MTTLSVRLSDPQARRLEARARALGIRKSDVVRQLVDTLEEEAPLSWDEILKDVRAMAAKVKPKERRLNRVLEERRKRRFFDRVR
jgi:Arc/MetJ-type ribon-helix-helix transcriptional regulator